MRLPECRSRQRRLFAAHAKEHCKPSIQGEYRRAIDLLIAPAIGNFKVVDLERKDVASLHQKFRDKPYQAYRTLGVLSKMFNLAEVWGLRPDGSNPCRHVPKYREIKRERYLSQNELQRLGQVLSKVEQHSSETSFVVAAFRLLILTGCRLGEIQTLKWAYITDDGMELGPFFIVRCFHPSFARRTFSKHACGPFGALRQARASCGCRRPQDACIFPLRILASRLQGLA